ncbi:MAG: hypothetical protein WCO03_02080, partial [bacterium]
MTNPEIATVLLNRMENNPEPIYSITMQDVISSIANRLGEEALSLSEEDLQLAREEVKEAIAHNLDTRLIGICFFDLSENTSSAG